MTPKIKNIIRTDLNLRKLVTNQQAWENSTALSHDARREDFIKELVPHLQRLIHEGKFDAWQEDQHLARITIKLILFTSFCPALKLITKQNGNFNWVSKFATSHF
jgi:hypothetical protein